MKKELKILKVLENKEFFKLWIGQIFSYLGDAVVQIALMAWIISFVPQAGPEMAKILFFFMLPSFLLSPVAGVLADRFSRKSIMLLSNLYRAALVLVISILMYKNGVPQQQENIILTVYAVSFLLGTGSAFFYPAKQSSIPNLVKPNYLQFANALNAGTATISILLGAIITGMFISKIPLACSLLINSCIYIISGAIIAFIKFDKTLCHIKASKTNIINDFGFALSYLNTHKSTLRLILLSVGLSLITASFFNSLNAIATDYFHIGIAGLSKLKAMLGVGMILGTVATLYLSKKFKASFLLADSFIALFIATATAQFVNTYNMAWFWLIAIGMANAAIVITLDTLLQRITPDRLRGKIFGFRSTVTTFAFLSTTWIVSEVLKITSPYAVFKIVAGLSFGVALAILIFDRILINFFIRTVSKYVMKMFFSIEVEGEEYLKASNQFILAGNHTGWLDTLILQAGCRRPVWFIAGPVAFSLPVVGWLVKYLNVIPLHPRKGVVALDQAVDKLHKGDILCIFPEGKLTPDGKLCKFNRGVGYMHQKSKAPIIPFVIQGGYEAWKHNKALPNLRKITIQFGQPINMPEAEDKEIAQELKTRVQFIKDSLERREKSVRDESYYNNVLSLMQTKSDHNGAVKALSLKDKDGWKELSYIELSRQAKNFGNYLISQGIERGDRIAILSESRPEWGIAFFASIQTGAITVPLDIKLTLSELTSILSDCLPRVLCVSTHYLETARELKNAIPSIEQIYIVEEDKGEAEFPSVYEVKGPEGDMGRERSLDETALIVYTSGTTGNPKGVMTTFGNIIAQLKDFEQVFSISSEDSLVSILPLNHLLELNVGFLGMLNCGAKISYSKSLSPKEIAKVMQEKQVTHMIAVPLFVKMLKSSVEKELRKLDPNAKKLFDFMYNIAKYMPLGVKRIMFGKIHEQFGGKMKGFVCGGAPLDLEVGEFFERIGIPVYQGYGLTETSPTITTNSPEFNRNGSVGKPLPSVMVRISEEGEILSKGPNLMKGYYNKPDMTTEVIDENGWFHTGDIGEFDKDGYLHITGRIKNMIVLGGGKKIFPEEVEAVLEKSPAVKELCVMSVKIQGGSKDGTEEVCAVIVPSDDLAKKYKDDFAGLEKEITDEINKVAKAGLASYKCPTVTAVSLEELPKTATRKVKRKDVQAWYYERFARV